MASAYSGTRAGYTYGIADNMRRLGQDHRSGRWQVAYLTLLIANEGFPAPLPLRVGDELTTAVRPRSRWSQDSVDRWFHDRTPPSDHVDAAGARVAGDIMDARAAAFAPPRLVAGTDLHGEGTAA